jgi:hypothetical protein
MLKRPTMRRERERGQCGEEDDGGMMEGGKGERDDCK